MSKTKPIFKEVNSSWLSRRDNEAQGYDPYEAPNNETEKILVARVRFEPTLAEKIS